MLGNGRERDKLEAEPRRGFNGGMALDHHWVFFALDDDDAIPLEERFERMRPVGLPSDSRRALARWQARPRSLVEGEDATLLVGFHSAFRLGWAEEIGREVARTHGLGFQKLTFSRISPAQLLFCGLGPRRALGLPGLCGNLLVPRTAVPRALEDAHRSCDVAWDAFLENARPFASGFATEAELRLVLDALPRALAHAEGEKKALLGLSVSDCAFE